MQAERKSIGPTAFALGHLLVFYPGALLVLGRRWNADWLVVGGFFVGLSALRAVIGDLPTEAVDLSERTAQALEWLPKAYSAFFAALSAWMAMQWGAGAFGSGGNLVWFGVGCWLVASLATCPAHELAHRRSRRDRALGRALAAVAGYAPFGQEHLAHHANPGNTVRAEYPRRDHSLYAFIGARWMGLKMWRAAWEWERGERIRKPGWRPDSFGVACGLWLATWACFAWLGGWRGLVWYGVQSVGVHFSLHLIAYLQHWGLGDDAQPEAKTVQYAWEDTCLSQAWVTMGVSLHQAHHKAPSRPYYRLAAMKSSPRLPGSYAIMMVAALVPPLWRKLMVPALDYWQANPERPIAPGKSVFCLPGAYSAASKDTSISLLQAGELQPRPSQF
jgi:alkane 1-monooxygenase